MNKYAISLLLSLSLLAFARPTRLTHPTAFDTYISFKGSSQGLFKAQTQGKYGKETEGWFKIQSFDLQGESPADASQSGKPTAQRQHKPTNVVKEVDASSPLLRQALATNETLSEVVIEIVGRPTTGQGEVVTERITLTNATISQYKTDHGVEDLSLNYVQLTRKK
jgi:type VI secretion system Hcp family effector